MNLHWIHTDCLSVDWIDPAQGPAVFVWDDRQLAAEGWGLKRVAFIYECLLDLPGVELWHGRTADTLEHLVRDRHLHSVVAVHTPDPWLQAQASLLAAAGVPVEWRAPEAFVTLAGPVDLRRFSRYWRKAEPVLFS